VYVLGARDVPVADITGTSDPYVRVSLLRIGEQGGGHKKDDARRTRVRSKTLEPVWAQVRLFLFLFLFLFPYG
jgi:Ca2+-dependent lipid-binding protein